MELSRSLQPYRVLGDAVSDGGKGQENKNSVDCADSAGDMGSVDGD